MTDVEVMHYATQVRYVYLLAMKYIDNLASAAALESGYRARINADDDKSLASLLQERDAVEQRLDAFKAELCRLLQQTDINEAMRRAWIISSEVDSLNSYKSVNPGEAFTRFPVYMQVLRGMLPPTPAAAVPAPIPLQAAPLMPRASGVVQ